MSEALASTAVTLARNHDRWEIVAFQNTKIAEGLDEKPCNPEPEIYCRQFAVMPSLAVSRARHRSQREPIIPRRKGRRAPGEIA